MAEQARAFLAHEGVPDEARSVVHALDVRYVAQEYTLTVPLLGAAEPGEQEFLPALAARFAQMHEERFGHANLGAPIEIVTVRTTGFGDLGRAKPAAPEIVAETNQRSMQPVVFGGRRQPTTVVRRSGLAPGDHLPSPAIVLEETATTVVPPGFLVTVDDYGNLVLSQEAAL